MKRKNSNKKNSELVIKAESRIRKFYLMNLMYSQMHNLFITNELIR